MLADARHRRPDRDRRQRLAHRRAHARRCRRDRRGPPLKIVGIPASIDNDLGLHRAVDRRRHRDEHDRRGVRQDRRHRDRARPDVHRRGHGARLRLPRDDVGDRGRRRPRAVPRGGQARERDRRADRRDRARRAQAARAARAPRDHHQGRGRRDRRSTG